MLYHGKPETIDHIVIQRYDLLVHLKESNISVNSDKIQLEPTRIPLGRTRH